MTLALKNLALSGIASGGPTLRLIAVAGTGASPLKSVTLLLPDGVSVTHASAGSAAVSIVGTPGQLRFRLVKTIHGIRIICRSRTFGVSLRIAAPALALSPHLVASVREHGVRELQATLVVSDTEGGRARFPVVVPAS